MSSPTTPPSLPQGPPAPPPPAKARNPADAFELYEYHSTLANSQQAAAKRSSPPSRSHSRQASFHADGTGSSGHATPIVSYSGLSSGQVTPFAPSTPLGPPDFSGLLPLSHTPSRAQDPSRPDFSRRTTAATTASDGTGQAPMATASANSSTWLLGSPHSTRPYQDSLVTFRGKTLISDPGFKLGNLAGCMFLMGWSDASNGAQLPYIQSYYHLEYLQVATLFVCNFAGWVLSAIANPFLTDRQGLGRTLVVGGCIQTAALGVVAAAPPFAVVALAFVGIGLGIGIVSASSTSWTSARPQASVKLGIILASYGLGALLAPIAAGLLAKQSVKWSRFYLISLGLSVLSTVTLAVSFRFESEESWYRRRKEHKEARAQAKATQEPSAPQGQQAAQREVTPPPSVRNSLEADRQGQTQSSLTPSEAPHQSIAARRASRFSRSHEPGHSENIQLRDFKGSKPTSELPDAFDDGNGNAHASLEEARGSQPAGADAETSASEPGPSVTDTSTSAKFKRLSKFKALWIISVFSFANTGTEVSIGGWTSSYLKDYRSVEGETAEWVVSAFWAGLMVGRIVLIPVTRRIGEQRAIYVYLGSWLILEILVWLVPNFISTAVTTSLAGLALGPCFPILASLVTQFVPPRSLHTTAVGLLSCAAQSGSAFFPFLVGLLAQAKGVKVLEPFVVACLVMQIGIWALLGWPRRQVRAEE